MHTNTMAENKLLTKGVAIVSALLLVPGLMYAMSIYIAFIAAYLAVSDADPAEKSSLLSATISVLVNGQYFLLAILVPGVIGCSVSVLMYKVSYSWLRNMLVIVSVFLVLILPFGTAVGAYLYYLTKRAARNA